MGSATRPVAGSGSRRRSAGGVLLLFTLFGALYVVPPAGGDRAYHVSGIAEARSALREGQFPIRIAPNVSPGRRYPLFQFYGNLPYTAPALLTFVPGLNLDAYTAWKVVTCLSIACAGFYAYRVSLSLTRQVWPSVVAGAIFVTSPYLATDVRARFAYAETTSFCLLAPLLYYNLRAFATRRNGPIIAAGACWALVSFSHNITYLYASALVALFFALLIGSSFQKYVRRVTRLLAAYALGLLLAAWYVVPQLQLVKYLLITLQNNYASPAWSGIWSPAYAIFSPVLSIAADVRNAPYLGVQIGWPILGGALLGVALLLKCGKSSQPQGEGTTVFPDGPHRISSVRTIAPLLFVLALSIFVLWTPFDFWPYVPKIFYNLQILYRMLMFVVLWGSVLAGVALAMAFHGRGGMPPALAWACVFAAGLASLPYAGWRLEQPEHGQVKMWSTLPFMGHAEKMYEPAAALIEPFRLRPADGVEFISANKAAPRVTIGRITRYRGIAERPALLQLPLLFYPGVLDVRDRGRVVTDYGHVDGLLAIPLAPGPHRISVRFVGSRWANRASTVAWIGVAVAAAFGLVRANRRTASPALDSSTNPIRRRRPEFPLRAAAFGCVLLAGPTFIAYGVHRYRQHALKHTIGKITASSAVGPVGALKAFDGDPQTEWAAAPVPQAWLQIDCLRPRPFDVFELDTRRHVDFLVGWHRVTVELYRHGQQVGRQTFNLPDAATKSEHVLKLDDPQTVDRVVLRFTEPVTKSIDGSQEVPPAALFPGYREIRVR